MLGERLYPMVAKIKPELAGKITGMLLETETYEVLLLLESSEALEAKVEEAVHVLNLHYPTVGLQAIHSRDKKSQFQRKVPGNTDSYYISKVLDCIPSSSNNIMLFR